MYTWFCINKLSLNIDKTNYMIFTNKHGSMDIQLNINNINIQRVYYTKFLGVFIDHKLTWKEHISKVCGKVSRCTALLNKVKNVLSSHSLYTLYNSLIVPYLTYCVEVWGNTYKSNLNPLLIKQKRIIRIVCKANFLDHTAVLFKTLKTLPLFLLIKFRTAIFMYKVYNQILPPNLLNNFTHKGSHYNTRQCGDLYLKQVRTRKKQFCVSYTGTQIWNEIDLTIRNCKTLPSFKKKYKACLLSSLV